MEWVPLFRAFLKKQGIFEAYCNAVVDSRCISKNHFEDFLHGIINYTLGWANAKAYHGNIDWGEIHRLWGKEIRNSEFKAVIIRTVDFDSNNIGSMAFRLELVKQLRGKRTEMRKSIRRGRY